MVIHHCDICAKVLTSKHGQQRCALCNCRTCVDDEGCGVFEGDEWLCSHDFQKRERAERKAVQVSQQIARKRREAADIENFNTKLDAIPCCRCDSNANGDAMLMCGNFMDRTQEFCPTACHSYCLTPTLSSTILGDHEDWYCDDCCSKAKQM